MAQTLTRAGWRGERPVTRPGAGSLEPGPPVRGPFHPRLTDLRYRDLFTTLVSPGLTGLQRKHVPVHRATGRRTAALFNKEPHPVAMTTTS